MKKINRSQSHLRVCKTLQSEDDENSQWIGNLNLNSKVLKNVGNKITSSMI
jgi:hypothetical protein